MRGNQPTKYLETLIELAHTEYIDGKVKKFDSVEEFLADLNIK